MLGCVRSQGEECVPTTWDIFHEKWGFMLIYWNLAGVPFAYTYQSVHILKNKPEMQHSTPSVLLLLPVRFSACLVPPA